MKRKTILTILISIIFFMFIPSQSEAQDRLSDSSTWFSKALNNLFPEKIVIHGYEYSKTRIWCSNNDLTHFKVKAGHTNIGSNPAFHIEGELILDPLPTGLKVLDGAKGKKYMLLLQGYLFSPRGKVIWSQKGYPHNNSWVSETGSASNFNLINSFSGSLKGCTAAILAIGDPIIIKGTTETRVILGMKLISFKDNTESTSYIPSISRKLITKSIPKKTKKILQTSKPKYTNLQYVEKKHSGLKYTEVVNIPLSERKKIFYELVDYQDKTGDDVGAYKVIAKRYGLPEKAVNAISTEGMLKMWPMP